MSDLAVHGGPAALEGLPPFPSWPQPGPVEEESLLEVLRSGRWGSTAGNVVATFEREFAAYQDAQHGVALANGTLAIAAALRALGVGIGDEVVVPPYTFIATASAALFVGAVPVFADVDPATHLIDPDATAAAVTERTRAVVAVHLGGRAADMDRLRAVADAHGLGLVEDCAQAIGTRYRGRAVGALGHVGTFSFQSSKNMTAGEGGLVTTNDQVLADRLYSLVNVGRSRGGGWYAHESVGYNLRLTEFQGAVLRAQLARHPQDQEVRTRNAELVAEALGHVEGVVLPAVGPDLTSHGHHLLMLRLPELGRLGLRDAAVEALAAEGARPSAGYVPLHRNRALVSEARSVAERLGQPYPEADCPGTDLVASDTIWFSHNHLMGSEDQTLALARAVEKVVTAPAALRGTTLGARR